jgi:hypothetical protein
MDHNKSSRIDKAVGPQQPGQLQQHPAARSTTAMHIHHNTRWAAATER